MATDIELMEMLLVSAFSIQSDTIFVDAPLIVAFRALTRRHPDKKFLMGITSVPGAKFVQSVDLPSDRRPCSGAYMPTCLCMSDVGFIIPDGTKSVSAPTFLQKIVGKFMNSTTIVL